MRMTVSEAKKHVIGPAIRQHGKGRTAPRRNSDELKSLGIGPQELPQLASRIQSLLQQHGWSIDLKHLKTIRPNTRVGELTRVVADHSTVSAPKACANGHPQAYPGQTVCDLDGLYFE